MTDFTPTRNQFRSTPYFKRDAQFRARLFDPRSFEHDAKANLYLVHWLAQTYTRPGELVLDPMAGTGSLFLAATVGGRRVVCGELETWLRPILESNRRRAGSMAHWTPGAYQGDAAKLPFASVSIDHLLFSPPYWDTFSDWHISSRRMKRNHQGPHGSAYSDERGAKLKKNAGNEHVYETFLRTMATIYRECQRVLKPGGRLILIVKDRIAGGLRVPIVGDMTTLLQALGFAVDDVLSRDAQLTQYRQLQKAKGMPIIEDEQVIVCQKHRWPDLEPPVLTPFHWRIVMPPDVDHGPPQQVYQWMLGLARGLNGAILFNPGGRTTPVALWPEPPRISIDPYAHAKFTNRKKVAFEGAAHLVVNHGLRAGDRVTLYVPWRYAAYLERRLTTFGAVVDVPLKGLNMGQKMTRLKELLK